MRWIRDAHTHTQKNSQAKEPSFEFSTQISGKIFDSQQTTKYVIRMSAGGKNDDIIITHDLLDITRNNNNKIFFLCKHCEAREQRREKEKIYRNHKS